VLATSGDDLALGAAELTTHLAGARWHKLIGSGYAAAAAVERAGQRSVFVGEVGSEPATLKRIRVFSEAG
jgi:hypothetical protein